MSPARLGQLARSGHLQSVRVEGRLMFRADSVEAYRAESGRDGEPAPEGAPEAWESDLASLSGWLGDISEAVAPFEGLAPLPQVLPAAEDVPLDFEEEPEPAAAVQPAAEAPPEPVPEPQPEPQPEPEPEPQPEPVPEPLPEAQPEPEPPAPAPAAQPQPPPETAPRPSRQALLAVQPVQRFAVLKDVSEALTKLPGVTGVRLERLDSGVASYRLTFAVEMPPDEALAGAVTGLGLSIFVVGAR